MKIIVGLGNPGDKYAKNRHNVGWMVLDAIQRKGVRDQGSEIRLLKPDVFMNESGIAVRKAVNFYKVLPTDIILIHDDLDIKLGEFKIEMARGPKQHNGVASVEKELGTKDFLRVRVGVDNRNPRSQESTNLSIRIPGEKYVLENFTEDERRILGGVIVKIVDELKIKYAIK